MERQYSRKGNQKYPIYSNRYTDGPHILVGEPRYNRYITEGPHQYMGEPRYRYASEGPHQYMGEPREERYASEGPHQYMGEPREDERMAAIERQLDILLQAQLQQLQQQQQNQVQQQQPQIQQEEPHLNIQPGQILNIMPAEPAEKNWEKMLQTLIDDNEEENPKNKMPSMFRKVIEKYVSKKIDSEKDKLQKQNQEYESKIKTMEAEILKLKNQMQDKKAITGTEQLILVSRICADTKFNATVKKMTELTMQNEIAKVNNTLSSFNALDNYAKLLGKRIERSVKARSILQDMNFFVNNWDGESKFKKNPEMQQVWQRLPNEIRELIGPDEYDGRQKTLKEPFTKKDTINLYWEQVENYLIA